MYSDFVTCKDQPAHRTVLSATLFLEQNIKRLTFCRARYGPKLSAKLVCHSLFGGGWGAGSDTANSISRRQRDTGHVFEIKDADYQTTC